MGTLEDYYKILQVHPLAEPEVIEAAYKKLAQKYHPDVNKNPAATEKMKMINVAHDVLRDPDQRKRYDSKWLQGKGSSSGKPNPTRFRLVVKDHNWHDVEFDNLKDWVKKRKDILDAGEELAGKTFRYKFDRRRHKYQIRLRHNHSSAVYDPFH